MAYSKRWELVHLLGGKCVDCGNENFYDLELDHINNDGDGERDYYTHIIRRYIHNPERAKQRLAVRCKTCHEKRHHPSLISINDQRIQNITLCYQTLKTLEGSDKTPITEFFLTETSLLKNILSYDEIKMTFRRLLREASIYQSRPGCYNTV